MLANLEVKWLYDVIALEESRSFTGGQSPQYLPVLVQPTHPVAGGFPRIQHLRPQRQPLQLTNRGKIFVGYARNMLDDMDFQISRIKGLNNTTQKIRIDAAPSLSVLLLPEIIAGYTDRKNKTFHVESINVNDAVFNLKEGKSDFILSFYNEELMNYPFINHKIFDSYLHRSPLRRTWPAAVSFTSRRAAADEIRQRQLYGAPVNQSSTARRRSPSPSPLSLP